MRLRRRASTPRRRARARRYPVVRGVAALLDMDSKQAMKDVIAYIKEATQ